MTETWGLRIVLLGSQRCRARHHFSYQCLIQSCARKTGMCASVVMPVCGGIFMCYGCSEEELHQLPADQLSSALLPLPMSVHEQCMQLWYTQYTYTPAWLQVLHPQFCPELVSCDEPQANILYGTCVSNFHLVPENLQASLLAQGRAACAAMMRQQPILQHTCRITDECPGRHMLTS